MEKMEKVMENVMENHGMFCNLKSTDPVKESAVITSVQCGDHDIFCIMFEWFLPCNLKIYSMLCKV